MFDEASVSIPASTIFENLQLSSNNYCQRTNLTEERIFLNPLSSNLNKNEQKSLFIANLEI